MTIGIGVLATSEEARKKSTVPDTAILLADTMGSYEDVDSHARLHKLLMFPDDRVYAVAAGDISRAAQLMPCICTFLRNTTRRTNIWQDTGRHCGRLLPIQASSLHADGNAEASVGPTLF